MALPRAQLFEWNDTSWAPAALRDTIVESLSRTLAWGRMLEGLVGPFEAFLAASGATEVLDLCAGAAGPAEALAAEITRAGRTPPHFVLTDLYPQPDAWRAAQRAHPGIIDFEPAPVDATAVPPTLGEGRARVVINAMHHFPPPLATAILRDAVHSSRGVFVAEAFSRNPLQFANFGPAGIPALLANPLLSKRDRLAKMVLTWLTPVALAASVWDGLVSTLRVYTEEELRAMVAPFGAGFRWSYGTYAYPPAGTGYFFYGVPR